MRTATLENGLRVVLVNDPRASDVQVTMQYGVGSIHDPAGQEGMAHLVEHLMFQQVLGAQSLFAKLTDIATTFNATTSSEVTTYTSRARPEKLDELLSIEAVRVGFRCTSIADSAFEREREVVNNELRLRDFSTELYRSIYDAVYPAGHPYRRTFADNVASVSQITRDQACIFADTHYTTTNAVLVVSGNVSTARLSQALDKFLGKVKPRATAPEPVVVPAVPLHARTTVEAPLDEEVMLFTWPMPADRGERVKVLAASSVVEAYIDDAVRGSTVRFLIGDERARVLCVAVLPRGPQGDIAATVTEKLAKLEQLDATDRKLSFFDRLFFTRLHQQTLRSVYERYEEGSARDELLVADVLVGRDPRLALADDARALETLTFADMLRVIREQLSTQRMSVATLKPRAGAKHGVEAQVVAPVHDLGQRRDPPDVAEARRPHAHPIDFPALDSKRTFTLPNGLAVVLLPVTSIPTVEMRLVFRTGTGDDPQGARGAALVAARAVDWPTERLDDLLNFAAAGASRDVEATFDTTAFIARGLDMHLDFLLTGLARWVREGTYSTKELRELRALAPGEEAALEDAWRAAVYGPQHPYAKAGLARHIDAALTMDDVFAFHDAHHSPKNATLVIAGKFDATLAQRWVEHLFADWQGPAVTPATTRAALQPVTLAVDEELAQTRVRIALPATGSHAAQLVLAQMLDGIAADVRHQLGASYVFTGSLIEARLASHYLLDGRIDAPRTREALELVSARIAALRRDPDEAARAFVIARKRTLARLRGLTASAGELATRVHADLSSGGAPLSDATTAAEVQRLTIDQLTAMLAELDLARAAMYLRGPSADVDAAFAALGRTARRIPKTRTPAAATATEDNDEVEETFEVEDRPPPRGQRLALAAFAGVGVGQARRHDLRGYAVAASAGYRMRRTTTIGGHLAASSFDGTYQERELGPTMDIETLGLQLTGFIQAAHDRYWAAFLVGAGTVRVDDAGDRSWQRAISTGLAGGLDLLVLDGNRLGLYVRLDTDLFSDTSYATFTFGLGYRR